MKRYALFVFIIFLSIIVYYSFRHINFKEEKVEWLADMTYAKHVGDFPYISDFYVDYNGNAYIPDYPHYKIKKFNIKGKRTLVFGSKGEGPGEFRYIPVFAVDSRENFYFLFQDRILHFDEHGKFLDQKKVRFSSYGWPVEAKFSPFDDLLISFANYSPRKVEYKLVLFSQKDFGKGKIIYKTSRKNLLSRYRALAPFIAFHPSFDFDDVGNIYVTDIKNYKILVFNKKGNYMRQFFKGCKREKIRKEDFFININLPKMKRLKEAVNEAEYEIARLKGENRYYPCIFRINVDERRIFVWTTKFHDGMFVVDVYDKKFKLIARRKFYNYIASKDRFSWIREGYLFMVDIVPDNAKVRCGKLLQPKINPSSIIIIPITNINIKR